MNQPPAVPHYAPAVLAVAASGACPPGRVTEVFVLHDDDCDVWADRPCNCEPEVTTTRPEANR